MSCHWHPVLFSHNLNHPIWTRCLWQPIIFPLIWENATSSIHRDQNTFKIYRFLVEPWLSNLNLAPWLLSICKYASFNIYFSQLHIARNSLLDHCLIFRFSSFLRTESQLSTHWTTRQTIPSWECMRVTKRSWNQKQSLCWAGAIFSQRWGNVIINMPV